MSVKRLRRSSHRERGVAAVEMAIVLPLLILLAFGVAEAAWAFSQQNAVRGVARESVRVAVHHPGATSQDIANLVCDDLDLTNPATVRVDGVIPGSYERGDRATVNIRVAYSPLTGFITAFNGVFIEERVEFVTEAADEPVWWQVDSGMCP